MYQDYTGVWGKRMRIVVDLADFVEGGRSCRGSKHKQKQTSEFDAILPHSSAGMVESLQPQ